MTNLASSDAAKKSQTEFEEKMKDRLRASIGDLMPDEVLRELVAKSIEEFFLKERKITDSWGRYELKPSILVEYIGQLVDKEIKTQASKWLTSNTETVSRIVQERIDKGVVGIVGEIITDMFSSAMYRMKEQITNDLSQRLRS